MTEKLRTIRLYGKLGTTFGREYRLAVKSTREAIRALCQLLPGFEAYMMNAKDHGMSFAIFIGKENITQDQLEHPVGDDAIRIAPVIVGNKKGGVLNIIAGVILVVAGAIVTYYGNPALGAKLAGSGYAMIVGGVVQMLSPTPKGLSAKDNPGNTASYSFNGPINTEAQGNPVPLLYGRLPVGSSVVSAGISISDAAANSDSTADSKDPDGGWEKHTPTIPNVAPR